MHFNDRRVASSSRHQTATAARAAACALAFSAAAAGSAFAADGTVIHVFGAKGDGDRISSGMTMDAAGVLYGTTTLGGKKNQGTVFRLVPPAAGQTAWPETVIFSFDNAASNGDAPRSTLWLDDAGDVFGTASEGAAQGAGNVFELTPPLPGQSLWTQTILHTFSGADGAFPESMPVPAANGTLFATTVGGGPANIGVFYSIKPPTVAGGAWKQAPLYTFGGGNDGAEPVNNLVSDAAGNFYGVTLIGGQFDFGTVFRLSPPVGGRKAWTETVIHTFTGGADGRAPDATLTIDAAGILYGTNASGGRNLLGNIFRMLPPTKPKGAWKFEVLHSFTEPAAGQAPHSGLLPDGAGGFYGTTGVGGTAQCGTIYHFTPPAAGGTAWTLSTLYSFAGGDGGGFPYGDLLMKDGTLYGTTFGSDSSDSLECNGASVAFQLVL